MSKKKKIIILATMLVLLVATGYLNIVLNNPTQEAPVNNITGGFFETYKGDRESTRSQEMLYLEAILASANSSAEAKTVAENKRQELIETMDKELVMEGLIKAKGFDEVIVTTSASLVNVIVRSAELTKAEVAQITQIVREQTGQDIDNIKIIPIE